MGQKKNTHAGSKVFIIVLSIFCILLIGVSIVNSDAISPLRQAGGVLVTPIEKGISSFGSWAGRLGNSFTDTDSLRSENEDLKSQVEALQAENSQLVLDKEELNRLQKMLEGKEEAPDDETLKKDFCMFDVKLDKKRHVVSFEKNEKKYNDSLRLLGFVAIVTLGLDLTAPQALAHYKLRDEQEKYFQQMKTEMCSDRQRNWSEDGKTGRLFVLFVGLVIGSYIRHIWKTTDLHSMFPSSLDMLDEMRNIRCIERQGHATKITPFVGKQVEIAKAFGLDIPVGCESGYKSKKVGRKRGRPKKNVF